MSLRFLLFRQRILQWDLKKFKRKLKDDFGSLYLAFLESEPSSQPALPPRGSAALSCAPSKAASPPDFHGFPEFATGGETWRRLLGEQSQPMVGSVDRRFRGADLLDSLDFRPSQGTPWQNACELKNSANSCKICGILVLTLS